VSHPRTYKKKVVMSSLLPHNVKTKRSGDITDETEGLLLKELHWMNKMLKQFQDKGANLATRTTLTQTMAIVLSSLEDYVTNPDDVVEINDDEDS